ncbi:MAG TPA: hypothetical protein VMZ30_13025 [Pyrinomonadaceae bacterium]|nr:hypothetical protein [Pyrinomonadaceae bacterium]
MSEENIETVRRFFKAVEERDLPEVLAAYEGKPALTLIMPLPPCAS